MVQNNSFPECLDNVVIINLKKIPDERGCISHLWKETDLNHKIKETYCSMIYPGIIKAWHLHKEMTLFYTCPIGNIKLVLYDERKDSSTYKKTQEIYLGENNHIGVLIPPYIWNGFEGLGNQSAYVINCASHIHTQDEIKRLPYNSSKIPYNWNKPKHR